MNDLIDKYSIPGATLAVSKDGRLIYAQGFGYADIEKQQKMNPRHLFRISSVSKPIAAVAVLKLVESKKIRLSDRVYSLLGELPLPKGKNENPDIYTITVEHLLNHTSGQAVYNRSGRISSPMQPPISHKISSLFATEHPPAFKYVAGYMKTQTLLNRPGEKFHYSNYGYALLGLLVEKITKMPFEQYVQTTLLHTTDIPCMQFGKTRRSQKARNEVSYYDLPNYPMVTSIFKREKPDSFPYAGRHTEGWGAAGAWIASSVDILKFINHVDGQRRPALLKPATLKTMVKKPIFRKYDKTRFWYGLGWRIQKKANGSHWYHNGSSNSGSAAIMLRTADGLAWSAHFNQRMPAGRHLYKEFNKRIWNIVSSIRHWPQYDLFQKTNSCTPLSNTKLTSR